MTREERKLALYCLKASSDYHSEVCEECINYPNCDHTIQDDVTETIIKALEQEPILDKIRAEIKQLPIYGAKFLNGYFTVHVDVDEVLQIIDKYRGEVDCRECKAEHDCYECEKYSESEES